MAKSKYEDTFPLLAEGYAREGMIDKEIAKKLGICLAAYYKYQNQYIEFMEAIKRGKAPVDVEVENSLLKRTKGFDYEETTVEYKPVAEGQKASPKSIKKTTKFIVPDVTACIFWLKNRKPDKWRDKQEIEAGEGLKAMIERVITDERPKE